jgi:hypothetical protein
MHRQDDSSRPEVMIAVMVWWGCVLGYDNGYGLKYILFKNLLKYIFLFFKINFDITIKKYI